MVRAYAQAYLLKRKIANEDAWLTGLYVNKALAVTMTSAFSSKRDKYFEKPLDIFPKTKAEKQAEIREERRKLVNWLSKLKAVFNNKKNTGSESNGNES